ncbi:hypothetical protein C7974DRAFT_72467 [Boeremia exigua]|uniref:uncharacterized protein n=1 Tax=Boeremia exigua TaxID=749465 RepID=UPI001E8E4369|nr:uncharacterized protein C7974DRAFT_72467 [Boeremia exigua]KAH6614193.1 hypothetical protein C7974DRAFT_72467 [Boeremia exigua]
MPELFSPTPSISTTVSSSTATNQRVLSEHSSLEDSSPPSVASVATTLCVPQSIPQTLQCIRPALLPSICKALDRSRTTTQEQQSTTYTKRQGHRIFSCDQCPRWYHHAKNLRDHKQTKHQGKRYKCDFPGCTKTVAQRKNLKRHVKNKHSVFTENEDNATQLDQPQHLSETLKL